MDALIRNHRCYRTAFVRIIRKQRHDNVRIPHWLICAHLVCVILGWSASLWAQPLLNGSDIAAGARQAGMGHAFCAMSDDASAFCSNVAGTAFETSTILSGSYTSLHGTIGTPLANLSWGGLQGTVQDISIGLNWLRLQSADQRIHPSYIGLNSQTVDSLLRSTAMQSFTPEYNDAFSMSAAHRFVLNIDWGWNQYVLPIEIPVGGTLRYEHAKLSTVDGHALSADLAFMIRLNLRDMFFDDTYPMVVFGYSVQNIGAASMRWDNSWSDASKAQQQLGWSIIQPLASLHSQLSIDYDVASSSSSPTRLGLEWKYRKVYSLRCGWMGSVFCAGLGADLQFFRIDYAYQHSSQTFLAENHQISLSFRLEHLFL